VLWAWPCEGANHRLSVYSNRGGEGEDTALVVDALARVASGGHAGGTGVIISEVIAGMFGAKTSAGGT
jgi:hypothetical protein